MKKDEVQRHKNSFHDMFKGSTKDKENGHGLSLNVPVTDATSPPAGHGSRGNVTSRPATARSAADNNQPPEHEALPNLESGRNEELKIAIATAKAETAALRQELERVKQDAHASVEISRYQAPESHRQAIPENGVINPYIHHNDDDDMNDREELLINQNNKLRSRLTELEDQLVTQSALYQSEALHSEEDWNALTLRLHAAEKDSNSRLQQLLSLKSSISSLTRADPQASDSELADAFSQLANRVREWVVSNYRRTKMSFDNLPENTVQILRSIKVNYWETDPAEKLALYQAIVSRMLLRIFEEPFLVGMPDQDILAGLRTFSKATQRAGAASWEWRRTTTRLIESITEASVIFGWKIQALEGLAFDLEAIMRSISSAELTAHARSALFSIMSSAADLQRTLCLQKATYTVIFFDTLHNTHDRFNDRAMESINDLGCTLEEDSEPSKDRAFLFCVFPCLEKAENGIVNIVIRARVCCGVG